LQQRQCEYTNPSATRPPAPVAASNTLTRIRAKERDVTPSAETGAGVGSAQTAPIGIPYRLVPRAHASPSARRDPSHTINSQRLDAMASGPQQLIPTVAGEQQMERRPLYPTCAPPKRLPNELFAAVGTGSDSTPDMAAEIKPPSSHTLAKPAEALGRPRWPSRSLHRPTPAL